VSKQLTSLTKRIGELKIDDRALAKAVSDAIAVEFEPFKQAVKDAKAESFVADLTSIRAVDVLACREVFGIDVGDVKHNDLPFTVWNSPDSPEIDPDFIWTADILRHLSLSDATGENVWFGGEKGTGKSETARQFAARTGRSFKRINFHKHTSAEEYLGATGLQGGDTVFEPKDFLTAFTTPSTVILLDEITNADAGELAPLNGLLEPNACVSYGGKVWRRAAGVLIFAADNTFGSGDETGRYTGTRNQNSALIDRFSRIIPFTFLPKQQEIEAIANRAGCTTDLAKHVYAAIYVARGKVEKAEIVDAPSIRSAIAFCRACKVLPPEQAWETTVVARQPSESAAVLRGIFEVCINKDVIANNI
jgi:MoxR-like ATPase